MMHPGAYITSHHTSHHTTSHHTTSHFCLGRRLLPLNAGIITSLNGRSKFWYFHAKQLFCVAIKPLTINLLSNQKRGKVFLNFLLNLSECHIHSQHSPTPRTGRVIMTVFPPIPVGNKAILSDLANIKIFEIESFNYFVSVWTID